MYATASQHADDDRRHLARRGRRLERSERRTSWSVPSSGRRCLPRRRGRHVHEVRQLGARWRHRQRRRGRARRPERRRPPTSSSRTRAARASTSSTGARRATQTTVPTGGLSATATTLTSARPRAFGVSGNSGTLTIDTEQMGYTVASNGTDLNLIRAVGGTTAAVHTAGTAIYSPPGAGSGAASCSPGRRLPPRSPSVTSPATAGRRSCSGRPAALRSCSSTRAARAPAGAASRPGSPRVPRR